MVKLSVNINKIALIRNARGGNVPNLSEAAQKAEQFGAQGITVHPRPDQRHITYQDVEDLKKLVTTELNVEGYPSESFIELVCRVKPHQVTLVPDPPDALTSNAGWDTKVHEIFLREVVTHLKNHGIRVSIFMDTDTALYDSAARTGTDRIELYTEAYATGWLINPAKAVSPYTEAAIRAHSLGMGLNAGHDLNMQNLKFFAQQVPHLLEVSIGHALISEALYLGLENTIQIYRRQLQ
ncbi:MAG: pyridoxine 5'-phosphate synthase [Bacteroidia bacterium]|jgi:pyridoxine 5-phosphate synthase|nr:pyridoxine 5'-phosphate synthase [Bacteroidia bacterium]MCC6768310.1 pyridoxine 5'-phosphate synthase [Bacteroidia bacterium]